MADKEFDVVGFVKNESGASVFKLQRMLVPGGKLQFSDAFATIGKKSGTTGSEFVKWLRENIFPGPDWGFYAAEDKPFFSTGKKADVAPNAPPSDETPGGGAGKILRRKTNKLPKGVEITPASIVEAPYDQAAQMIDKCTSKDVLRKALTLSQYLANKGAHMRHLMGRLEQV